MASGHKLNKHCLKCGCRISDKNKSGYCNAHRDRTGANNPFFGRKHSKETVDKIKLATADASKKLWEDDSYRAKVISGMTGLTRSDEFKALQSKNAHEQFKDPEQRKLRAERFKQTWKSGAIVWHQHVSPNFSKEQLQFGEDLRQSLGESASKLESMKTIPYGDKWIFPDFTFGKYIIEYDGDFWHANPAKYQATDIIHHNITAKDIWEHDKERLDVLRGMGYTVISVWASEYKADKANVIKRIASVLLENEIM